MGWIRLDPEDADVLSNETRIRILRILSSEEHYPAEIADKMGIDEQKVYYHIKKLEELSLVRKKREETIQGGVATYYEANDTQARISFLESDLVDAEKIRIVVGSPDEHGPNQVRARDNHLSAEIGNILGRKLGAQVTSTLDTEYRESDPENLVLLGGPLTNMVTRKFNENFPVKFEGEFPFQNLEHEGKQYSHRDIGVVQSIPHPENDDFKVIMLGGIKYSGTRASVLAFKDKINPLLRKSTKPFYKIIKGKDMDGDGSVDSYEVVD